MIEWVKRYGGPRDAFVFVIDHYKACSCGQHSSVSHQTVKLRTPADFVTIAIDAGELQKDLEKAG